MGNYRRNQVANYKPDTVAARASKSAVQTITTATVTEVIWEVEDYDTHGIFTPSGDFSTFPEGLYLVVANIRYDTSSPSAIKIVQARILVDSNIVAISQNVQRYNSATIVAWIGNLISAQDLTIDTFQDSGGNLNLTAAINSVSVTRIGAKV